MRSYRKRKKIQKRHFQLLEVMIAILVLILCAAPAFEVFTRMHVAQERVVRINERDHLVRLIQAKIVERLYANEIPIDIFSSKEGESFSFSDRDLDRMIQRSGYEASYQMRLIVAHTLKNSNKKDKFLVELTVKMKDQVVQKRLLPTDASYAYLLYIDSGALEKNRVEQSEDSEEGEDERGGEVGEKVQDLTQETAPNRKKRGEKRIRTKGT